MGKSSATKGARGENEVTELLRSVFPEVRRRVVGEERQDKIQGRDLENTPGFCVQSNLARAPRPQTKIREAIDAAQEGEVPLAFTCQRGPETRTDPQPWLVTLLASDLVELIRDRQTLRVLRKETLAGVTKPCEADECYHPDCLEDGCTGEAKTN